MWGNGHKVVPPLGLDSGCGMDGRKVGWMLMLFCLTWTEGLFGGEHVDLVVAMPQNEVEILEILARFSPLGTYKKPNPVVCYAYLAKYEPIGSNELVFW